MEMEIACGVNCIMHGKWHCKEPKKVMKTNPILEAAIVLNFDQSQRPRHILFHR